MARQVRIEFEGAYYTFFPEALTCGISSELMKIGMTDLLTVQSERNSDVMKGYESERAIIKV